MKTPVFTGSSVAIVTPFDSVGKVNFDKLGELIDWQIEQGTNSITICGTTGEASTLTDREHMDAITFCVKKVAGRVPVIAGTGSNDTEYAIFLSEYAKEAGADALLHVTPYYNKTTQRGLVRHFSAIADRVNLPVIVYNVPSRTGMTFTADTYLELSRHPGINGVKEASGNMTLISETINKCGDELNIWSGNDDNTVPIMALGGKGVISTSANVIPGVMADICRLYYGGRCRESAALALKYFPVMNDLFIEVNPIPVKTALNLMGMDVGGLRMPLCDMSPGNTETLKATLMSAGLI